MPLNNEDYDFIIVTEKAIKKNYTHSFHHICQLHELKQVISITAIHAFNISNNIIPIKKQSFLKWIVFLFLFYAVYFIFVFSITK